MLRIANIVCVALALLAYYPRAKAQSPSLLSNPSGLLLGPITVTQPVQGVQIKVVSSTYLSLDTTPEGLHLNAHVSADLSDLQAKIGTIIDTIPLPRDDCRSYSTNNPVVTIWGKELKAEGHAAILWLHGKVELWDCRQNPIPNRKLEMRPKTINLGIKKVTISVPVVVTWPGNPIKNHIGTQPFDISEPVQLNRTSPTTVELVLGDPDVHLEGQYVEITRKILSIIRVDFNSKARNALRKAIDPSKLRVSVPPEYAQLNPIIDEASFESNGGKLMVAMALEANVPKVLPNKTISQIIDILQKQGN